MPPMSPRFRRSHVLVSACVILGLTACGGGSDAGDAERFCSEVAKNKTALIDPDLTAADNPDEAIDALLDEYRRIGEFAPLSIEVEWDQLVAGYEAAAEVIPGDTESEQEALLVIYGSEEAAVAIAAWLKTNCGVKLGPLATIVGAEVTTTIDPATTDAP